jgi:hypothetical protein
MHGKRWHEDSRRNREEVKIASQIGLFDGHGIERKLSWCLANHFVECNFHNNNMDDLQEE